MLKAFLKRIFTKGTFASNVAVLGSGTALGQLSLILMAPILTRLYGPEHFGNLQFILSLGLILASMATLKYDLAIPLPKVRAQAFGLLKISSFIATTISVLLFILTIVLFEYGSGWEKLDRLGTLILFIPLIVFSEAGMSILGLWAMRESEYSSTAVSRSVSGSTIGASQIVLFFSGMTVNFGLILGQIIGQIFGLLTLFVLLFRKGKLSIQEKLTQTEMRQLVSNYRAFPLFSSWNSIFNTLARNMPALFLVLYFPIDKVGFFALGMRLVNLPLNLIGNSIGQVFYQHISKHARAGVSSFDFFKMTVLKLFLIITPPMSLIYFGGETIFALLLGDSWSEAGQIASLLVPFFLVRFIASPMSSVFAVYKKQHIVLSWQIIYACCVFIIFYIGGQHLEFLSLIEVYSWSTAILFLILFFLASLQVVRRNARGDGSVEADRI